MEARRTLFRREMEALTDSLLLGNETFIAFQIELQRQTKDLLISAYMAGRGGQWNEVGPVEWGRLGAVIKRQYNFIRGFASDIQTKVPPMSRAQILQRIGYYSAAATEAFERGVAAQIGMNASILPAVPGDGTSICRTNCRCRWSIRVLSQNRGDFNVSWRLGAAEHCTTCRQRARHRTRGGWQQLRIRVGLMIDTPADIFAN